MEPKKYKGKLTLKAVIAFIIFALILVATCSFIGYRHFTKVIEEIYDTETYEVANIIIDYLNVNNIENSMQRIFDAENDQEREQIAEEIENTQEYKDLIKFLDDIRKNVRIEEIYIADFRDSNGDLSDTATYFAGVYGENDKPEIIHLGDMQEYIDPNDRIKMVYDSEERLEIYLKMEDDNRVLSMTAIQPIFDSDYKMVGVVSVSEPMTILAEARLDYLYNTFFYSAIATFVFIFIFVYLNRQYFTKPMHRIIKATNNFAQNGNCFSYELDDINSHDEVEMLAKSLLKMETEVDEFIELSNRTLRKQLEESRKIERKLRDSNVQFSKKDSSD